MKKCIALFLSFFITTCYITNALSMKLPLEFQKAVQNVEVEEEFWQTGLGGTAYDPEKIITPEMYEPTENYMEKIKNFIDMISTNLLEKIKRHPFLKKIITPFENLYKQIAIFSVEHPMYFAISIVVLIGLVVMTAIFWPAILTTVISSIWMTASWSVYLVTAPIKWIVWQIISLVQTMMISYLARSAIEKIMPVDLFLRVWEKILPYWKTLADKINGFFSRRGTDYSVYVNTFLRVISCDLTEFAFFIFSGEVLMKVIQASQATTEFIVETSGKLLLPNIVQNATAKLGLKKLQREIIFSEQQERLEIKKEELKNTYCRTLHTFDFER